MWHKIELLPTPFLHTPQGHLPFSSTLSFIQLNITFVLPIFIFKPFASNPDFHFTILSWRLSSLSAIKIKSSAYSNSRGKPAFQRAGLPLELLYADDSGNHFHYYHSFFQFSVRTLPKFINCRTFALWSHLSYFYFIFLQLYTVS